MRAKTLVLPYCTLKIIQWNFPRWHNHLDPGITKEAWTLEEELKLINAHRLHGNKWAEIAKVLPGRYLFLYSGYF